MPHGPERTFLQKIQSKAQLIQDGYAAGIAKAEPGLKPAGLLFAGMGASGATAMLVRDAASRTLDHPLTITQHHDVPRHVKPGWHVLAVSYSGETEETLDAVREASRRGCRVTAFTTGGTLAALAPGHVAQPKGYPPRVALAHAWFSVLGFLEGSGVLAERVPLEAALAAVREVDAACGPDVPEPRNEAKRLARLLHDRIPQIYTTPAFAGIGTFFTALLNETAKKIADVDEIPECNHNTFTGWSGDPNRAHFTILVLSGLGHNPDIAKRIEFMRRLHESWGVPWAHREFASTDSFAGHVVEQARALQLLEYVSYYTSVLRAVDPAEIEAVAGLKRFLRAADPTVVPSVLRRDASPRVLRSPIRQDRSAPRAGLPPTKPMHSPLPSPAVEASAAGTLAESPAPASVGLPALVDLPRPVRTVVAALQQRQPMTGGDLLLASGLPRRTVSNALRILRRRGWLMERQSLRDARKTYFWLSGGFGA